MLASVIAVMGYSVGTSVASCYIRRACLSSASKKASKKVETATKEGKEVNIEKVLEKEQFKAQVKYAVATSLVTTAGAAVTASIILNDITGQQPTHHHSAPTPVEINDNTVEVTGFQDPVVVTDVTTTNF